MKIDKLDYEAESEKQLSYKAAKLDEVRYSRIGDNRATLLLGALAGFGIYLLSGFTVLGEDEALIEKDYSSKLGEKAHEAFKLWGPEKVQFTQELKGIPGTKVTREIESWSPPPSQSLEFMLRGGDVKVIESGEGLHLPLPGIGNLHWHPPWPFSQAHKISLEDHQLTINYFLGPAKGPEAEDNNPYNDPYKVLELKGTYDIKDVDEWATMDKHQYGDEALNIWLTREAHSYINEQFVDELVEKIMSNKELMQKLPNQSEEFVRMNLARIVFSTEEGSEAAGEVSSELEANPEAFVKGFEDIPFYNSLEKACGVDLPEKLEINETTKTLDEIAEDLLGKEVPERYASEILTRIRI